MRKTDGVPLFLEELTTTLLESGLLAETGDGLALAAPLAIPPTLHDSLVARLDRLGESKETAQLGAALGREFSHELLAAVSELGDVELQNALDQLERAGLIFRRGFAPHATYSFKHALVRDAAYAGLLMSTRRRLHSRIAHVLKEKFCDRAELEPELLAFHFTEGGESAQAINYWLLAGQRAAERSANVEAVAHLRHGLKLIETLPPTTQTAQLELAFQSALGLPLIATKGYAAIETGAAYDRARELCDRVGTSSQLFPIMYGQGVFSLVHGDYRKGQRIFEEFLSSAVKEGEDGLMLVARRMLGLSRFLRGDLIGARNFIEQALAAYEPARHRTLAFQYGADPQSAGLAWLALDLGVLGFPAQAEQAALKAIALAEETAHAITQAHALRIGGCYASAVRRDMTAAHDQAAALKAYSKKQRMPYFRAEAEFFLAWSSAGERPSRNTISDMRAALVETGMGAELPFLLALLAEAHGRHDEPAAGLSVLDEALAALQNVEEFWWVADIHQLRGQLLLFLDANHAAAEGCYKKAIDLAQHQGAKFVELRTATDFARLLHAQGKHDEARAQLAPVYRQLAEGFELLDLSMPGRCSTNSARHRPHSLSIIQRSAERLLLALLGRTGCRD